MQALSKLRYLKESQLKKKKFTLAPSLNESILIWGIMTHLPMHKLVWELNKTFDFELIREPLERAHAIDIESNLLRLVEDEENSFPWFSYHHTLKHYSIEVIKNRKNNYLYLPELKGMDVVLLIRGESSLFNKTEFHSQLNQISGVQQAFEFQMEKITLKYRYLLYS